MPLTPDQIATCRANSATHRVYTDADANRPEVICDRNMSVVLGLCKDCGAAECELEERPCGVPNSVTGGQDF